MTVPNRFRAGLGVTLTLLFSVGSSRAEDLAPVPHSAGELLYQCGQGGHQAFVPQNNGNILYMDCANRSVRWVDTCASLNKALVSYDDDIRFLEEELKRPDSEATGIDLWNVNFDRETIERETLPNLKKDREKMVRILKYAESFLEKKPSSNPYQCALSN